MKRYNQVLDNNYISLYSLYPSLMEKVSCIKVNKR